MQYPIIHVAIACPAEALLAKAGGNEIPLNSTNRSETPDQAHRCAVLCEISRQALCVALRAKTRPLLMTGVDQHLPSTTWARALSLYSEEEASTSTRSPASFSASRCRSTRIKLPWPNPLCDHISFPVASSMHLRGPVLCCLKPNMP